MPINTPEESAKQSERTKRVKPWLFVKRGPRKGKKEAVAQWTENLEKLLVGFYSEDSPTKGNKRESAKAAGYSDSMAEESITRIFKKYEKRKFQMALKACGVTNLMMGMRLRNMIEQGADKDAINAIRLALAAKGEATDQQSGTTINAQGQVMVIVGANASRINALRTAARQPTAQELEDAENARCQARLDELKAMNRRPMLAEKVPDLKEADAPGDQETESPAG